MSLQNYTSQDLSTRTAIAACAIACKASTLAKKWRYGSIEHCEQTKLNIVTEQLNIIRSFKIIRLPSTTKLTVKSDGGTDTDTTITIGSVTISNVFRYTIDNNTTATKIAEAINDKTSTPNYTATADESVVYITSDTNSYAGNGLATAQSGGDVVISGEFTTGGQDGVTADDNIITETQLEYMFNNIAKFTGCCYAPLGYGYEDPPETDCYIPLEYNTLVHVTYNAGPDIHLNKKC
tara:strand:- start:2151 stop:2858 length:708 start_codon:yes stop_codon:yes gene_type:complete